MVGRLDRSYGQIDHLRHRLLCRCQVDRVHLNPLADILLVESMDSAVESAYSEGAQYAETRTDAEANTDAASNETETDAADADTDRGDSESRSNAR